MAEGAAAPGAPEPARPSADLYIDPEVHNFFRRRVEATEQLEEVLAQLPVFGLLTGRELRRLASLVHVRRYRPGEVVIQRGVEQSGFYLIRSGAVHIVRERPDGQRQTVATLRPYELLGEFALLDSSPRTSAVVAAEPSELVGFFRPDLTDVMVTRPAMGCRILLGLATQMSQVLKRDYERLLQLGFPAVPEGPQDSGQQATVDTGLS